jgi:hypothetical protein
MASAISSRGSGVLGGAVVFVVFLVAPTSKTAGTAIVFTSDRPFVVAHGWRKMTRNVLNTVVTTTEDDLVAAYAFASLDIDLFSYKVGLIAVADPSAHLLTCE